ncbi:MAG: PCMD domain-containing protein [Bacteroides sp.]|nr:PCMD domain-containing protein [Bacteroides sp.]
MSKIVYILCGLTILFCTACRNEDHVGDAVGYLRLTVGESNSTNSRSEVPEDYQPKQIAVQILDSKNQVVEETDDWEYWKGKSLTLKVGKYIIKAASNGFDGKASGFDIPYYTGADTVVIQEGEELNRKLVCTLANVKVTVKFDAEFVSKFKSVEAQVGDTLGTYTPVTFTATETRSAYFPVTSLYSEITVVNNNGVQNKLKNKFTDVKARDHYILNYKLAESGKGNVTVTVDPSTNKYEYTFTVSPIATNQATLDANPWSTFAWVEASSITLADGVTLNPEQVRFEYKEQDADAWLSVAGIQDGENYTAKITGLKPATTYTYRMVSGDIFESAPSVFTTEAATALYNGNFDSWYKPDKTWYAVAESDYASGTFWDSSNPGTTTGAGALVNVNPTQGNSTTVHTGGGQSAELKSQYASAFGIGKFAAASLYTGKFNSLVGTSGAKIDFGQPFISRPTALHGWFQYAPKSIGYVGGNQPSGTVNKGDPDICSIYIALAKKTYTIDNTDTSTFIQFETDDDIIAYGELPANQCVDTGGQWKEFTIDLKYKTLDCPEEMYLILVASSSKYGDYFTGGEGSILYLDDFELVYGDTPVMW